jgi:hypothetical protein
VPPGGFRHGVLLSCARGCHPAHLLLAHGPATRSLRPPWSGVSTSVWRTTPVTCVLRRWPGPGPGVQATEQFKGLAVRRPRDQAQARSAWLTPATPSEQPDDSVRVPWPDQIWPDCLARTPIALAGTADQAAAEADTADRAAAADTAEADTADRAAAAAKAELDIQAVAAAAGQAGTPHQVRRIPAASCPGPTREFRPAVPRCQRSGR